MMNLLKNDSYLLRKKSLNSLVFDRHCNTLFIKHVFPRLSRPVKPGLTWCSVSKFLFRGDTLHVGFYNN